MILGISIFGILVVLCLDYRLFTLEDMQVKEEQSESQKGDQKKCQTKNIIWKRLGAYFTSKSFIKRTIELLVIVLGATIAINFTEVYEKKQTREQVVGLLDLAQDQISASQVHNETILNDYAENNELGILKYNLSCDIDLISQILESEDALIILSPFTIGSSYSVIRECNNSKLFIEGADANDKNILLHYEMINSQLDLLNQIIDVEKKYVSGQLSKKEANNQFTNIMNNKFIRIE